MTPDFSILIADDNEMNLWLLHEQLEQWTTNITQAKDGREAWRFLERQPYSVIFLDVNMPFMSGFDVVAKMRTTDGPNRMAPAIAVTAHAQNQQRERAIASGFNQCLVKPIRLHDLEQVLTLWQQTMASDADYYATRVLRKTNDNLHLSHTLLSKLFAELPILQADIEHALENDAFQIAWDIVHKLHGTFCFHDFADCLGLVENLQNVLEEGDAVQAWQQFNLLKIKLNWLNEHQDNILARFADGAGSQ